MVIALIQIAFLLASPVPDYGKLVHVEGDETAVAVFDAECGPPRDFRRISLPARARAVYYWRFVALANADRIQRRRERFNADLTLLNKPQMGIEAAARAQREREALIASVRVDIQSIQAETMRAREAVLATLGRADRAVFIQLTLPRFC